MVKPANTSFEDLLQEREELLAKHQAQLVELENAIRAAARAKGFMWGPLGPNGGIRSIGHANAKQAFHDANRAECIRKGWLKADGNPDLERLRVEKKAERLGISPAAVKKQEAQEKLKKAEAKLKAVAKKS